MLKPAAAPFMRYADSVEQFIHVNEAHKSGALEYVYRGLDKLGTAAWTINRRVFETMGAVWNDGRAMAGIPVRDPHINIVDPAAEEALSSEDTESSLDPKGRFSQRQALRALLSARRSAYGQRCSVNYQLEIARAVSRSDSTFARRSSHACSLSAKHSTSLTTSTSEAAPIRSLATSTTLGTISPGACLPLRTVDRWGDPASSGSKYMSRTRQATTKRAWTSARLLRTTI